MNGVYGRDLDLNLLRVFVVVAESGSVTEAARRLYLTQPAISAAIKRLSTAIGAPLFTRSGRSLVLTTRGQRLFASARTSLESVLEAAFAEAAFDAKKSERIIRLGLSDKNEVWLLPSLVRELARDAPRMKLVVIPALPRTVGELLTTGQVDLAVSHARALPAGIDRKPLYRGSLVCLFDPKHVKLGKAPTRAHYLAQEHVTVSYTGDLRGIIENVFDVTLNVRVAVPTIHGVGALVDGSPLVATVPETVGRQIHAQRPHLAIAKCPFVIEGTGGELFSRRALADDDAVRFVAEKVVAIAKRWKGK